MGRGKAEFLVLVQIIQLAIVACTLITHSSSVVQPGHGRTHSHLDSYRVAFSRRRVASPPRLTHHPLERHTAHALSLTPISHLAAKKYGPAFGYFGGGESLMVGRDNRFDRGVPKARVALAQHLLSTSWVSRVAVSGGMEGYIIATKLQLVSFSSSFAHTLRGIC